MKMVVYEGKEYTTEEWDWVTTEEKLIDCDGFDGFALGLISLLKGGRITLEDARLKLADVYGVHILASSTGEFINDLADLI